VTNYLARQTDILGAVSSGAIAAQICWATRHGQISVSGRLRQVALGRLRCFVTASLLTLGSVMSVPTAQGAPDEHSLVEQGRYLVQAANCISCHTTKGGQPFAGGNAFATPYGFLGNVYSSNITPDRESGLGAWTEADFTRAMRHGVGRNGEALSPAFPYTAFTKLTSADIHAIYAYLKSVPPVHATPPDSSFWFRQRWAISLWKRFFFREGEFVPDPARSGAWNRGSYLVEALGHCGACHTQRDTVLAERTDARLAGGMYVDELVAGKYGNWSAPNLTSSKTGLGNWTVDDLQRYFKTGHSRRAGIFGPMNDVVGNSLRYLTDADITAMATYIKSVAPNEKSPVQSLGAEARASGQALYDKYCDECHLSSGRGGFRKAPPVAGSAIVQAKNAASLINVILFGATPAISIPPSLYSWEEMAGFKDKLTDVEVADLANFLRSSWGNRGGSVSPDSVAAQR
jgi:alcohol dehydrogenase (quinone), cytochrome c subunit